MINDLLHCAQLYFLTPLWVFLWCERLFLLANMFWHTSQDVSFGIFKYHHPSRAVISFDCLELLQLTTFPFTCKQLDEELQFIWVHIPRAGRGHDHLPTSQLWYFQLRYLQTLNNISAENNSTIVFPVPVDILSQLVLPQHQVRLDCWWWWGWWCCWSFIDLLIWILLMQTMKNCSPCSCWYSLSASSPPASGKPWWCWFVIDLNLVDAYDEQQHDCLLRWEVAMMMSAMVNKWNNVGLHPIIVLTHLTQS